MNIYFSCSLTGGRQDEAVYQAIVKHLEMKGCQVPTAHLARPDAMLDEAQVEARDVYLRDVGWIETCDAVIAEVSTPSHGVGYEIALALLKGKPVLCIYARGKGVSKMITGNDMPSLQVKAYNGMSNLMEMLDQFLAGL